MTTKKIGCVLAYAKNHNNYGTFLQGFAILKLIKDLGYEPEIIKYNKQRSIPELIKITPLYLMAGGNKMLMQRLKSKLYRKLFSDYNSVIVSRTKAVNAEKQKHMEPLSFDYKGFDELAEGSKKYGMVLVGSDQVWRPFSLYSKFYNLLFVDENIPKAAYSSSFGVSSIPKWQYKMTKTFLERLDKIGIREQSGKQIVETISSNKAKLVLDPSLLLFESDWENFINEKDHVSEKSYIFCYFLGTSQAHRRAVEKLKEKTGCIIVTIKYMDEFVKKDRTFGDIAPTEAGPFEFLKYIKDAAYVCTDSFHCTAFSLSFNKQFLTFYRHNKKSKNSTNTRIDSFLGLFNLQNRVYVSNINEQMHEPIDYNFVNKRLNSLRQDSYNFLKEELALSNNS